MDIFEKVEKLVEKAGVSYEDAKAALDKAIAESTIRETINVDFVNEMLVEMRKKAYGL